MSSINFVQGWPRLVNGLDYDCTCQAPGRQTENLRLQGVGFSLNFSGESLKWNINHTTKGCVRFYRRSSGRYTAVPASRAAEVKALWAL